MWNPEFIHTDIYRYTQDIKADGELLGAERGQLKGGRKAGRDQEEERGQEKVNGR